MSLVTCSEADPRSAVLAPYGGGWQARLTVELQRVAQRCVATRVEHQGPLRIQKVLHPEGPDLAHLLLLHPPSGLAGGDSVEFSLTLGQGAKALLTTPGAGRWYRADLPATQDTTVRVGAGASLEWLPQETSLHDGVQGRQRMSVEVAPDAAAIGTEVLVLGRLASGERLVQADFRARLSLRRDGRLLLDEASRIGGGDPGMAALAGAHVSGLLWAISPVPIAQDLAERIECELDDAFGRPGDARSFQAGGAIGAASRVDDHLLLVRAVGSSPELIRQGLTRAWRILRPVLIGREAVAPRIWMT